MTPTISTRRGQRGAVLVETAMVVPILIFLCFGIFEVGVAWRSSNELTRSVGSAIVDSGRQTDGRYSDLFAMERITASLAGSETLDWVIVYKTDDTRAEPSVDCLNDASAIAGTNQVRSRPDECVIFGGVFSENATTADFPSPTCAGDVDEDFCPADRDSVLTNATDRLGLAVQVQHDWLTGFLPGGVTLADHAVIPIITGINEARNAPATP